MTAPAQTVAIKLLLTTLLALTAAVTMGTAATVFVASDVASRAAAPIAAAGKMRSVPSQRALGRDLVNGSLQAIAANRSLPALVRYSAIRDALFGGCQNTREVLFGAAPFRHQAVRQMVASIADLPRAATIAPLSQRALDMFTAGTAPDLGAASRADNGWSARFSWIVPARVRNRQAFCERY